jgi:hypothetical protein
MAGIPTLGDIGVIFIDCWDANSFLHWQDKGGPKDDFYLNMIETLSNYHIKSYVFHTSFLSLDYVTQDTVNYFKEFILSPNITKDRQQAFKDYLEFGGTERLSRHLNALAGNSNAIFIPTYQGFQTWCQLTEIPNWIVVGGHWSICIHEKPLGFLNIYKSKKSFQAFYSIPSCTIKWVQNSVDGDNTEQICTVCTDLDYKTDQLSWDKINDNLYKL